MIVPIEDTYLNALSLLLESEKLDSLLQDTNAPGEMFRQRAPVSMGQTGCGIIWAVRKGTTSPELSLAFKFDALGVQLMAITRDERKANYRADFSGGIDCVLKELRTFLRANRLAAPK
jgi:hypothetical protein